MNFNTVPEQAIELIKRWEGKELRAYPDLNGIPTIGYGTTYYPDGQRVKINDTITTEEAEHYLISSCSKILNYLNDKVKVELNPNQISALISIVYNIGKANFTHSLLLKFINEKKFEEAAEQFMHWTFSAGVKIQGLVNRRKDEQQLFHSPLID